MSDFKSNNSTEFKAMGSLTEGYTVVPNGIMNNIINIGADAFTVLVKIFQFINSPTHKISVQGLSTQTGLSKTRVSKGINKLIELGYIVREAKKSGNLTIGYTYFVYDTPIENTNVCRNPEIKDPENNDRENGDAKKENNKKENNKKENEVVVVVEKLKTDKLIKLCNQYKIQKKVTPTLRKLLEKYSSTISIEVFEQIFIDASSENVRNAYRYIEDVLKKLSDKNIKTLDEYLKDKESFKNKNKNVNASRNKTNNTSNNFNPKIHNFPGSRNHMKYSPEELERKLLESQREKFKQYAK